MYSVQQEKERSLKLLTIPRRLKNMRSILTEGVFASVEQIMITKLAVEKKKLRWKVGR